MTSKTGQQIFAITYSRRKGNQKMKIGLLIEYTLRNIF